MLWSSKRDPALAGFFIDEHTFALGAGGWGARMADLVNQTNPSDSAATNLELVRLVERAAGTHAIWGAAIVPADTRRSLAAQPGLSEAATINTMSAAIDFGQGHGGGADRRRRDAGRRPLARDQGRPSRCATPNATRRC